VVAVSLAVLLAACGSSSGGSSLAPGSGSSGTPASSGPDVKMSSTSLGSVLTDASGRTLYLLTSDRTSLACTGGCLTIWAPLMLKPGSTPQAGTGVSGALGTVARGSAKQITISGHPLYTYTGDSGSGQTNGQGIATYGGVWYVLSGSGAPVTTSGGGGATSSPSGGYQY
jgi:predicted lipoprotein with Yx(FWY)xxD motif